MIGDFFGKTFACLAAWRFNRAPQDFMRSAIFLTLLFTAGLAVAKPPAGFGTPDIEITLGTKHGQMRFDKEALAVPPGAKVKILLKNTCEMLHNWVLVKGGTADRDRVSGKALQLGAQSMVKHFVPEDPAIVASSQIAMPGKDVEVYFVAPKEEGDYPYVCTLPGHAFTMVGVMAVSKNPQQALNRLNKARPQVRAQQALLVTDKPLLQRAFVQNSPARSICVGLPGGVNYLFDAEACAVQYGWTGAFLDVGPDRKGRGGRHCRILGQRFEVGALGALQVGDAKPVFEGYSRLTAPEMFYRVGNARVRQLITLHAGLANGALKRGLQYTFKVADAKGNVTFRLNPEQVVAEASAGKWSADKSTLTLSAKDAAEFTVTLLPKK